MKVLLVHNRYRSAFPSGENAVVDDEAELLAEAGCDVERLEVESDSIAELGAARRALVPAGVVWSRSGGRLTSDAIARVRPDVVHFHNTFPLLSPSSIRAARSSRVAVVATLHNFRPLCPIAIFLRDGRVCEDCLGRVPWPGVVHGCYRDSPAATAPIAAMITVHRALGTWTRCIDRIVLPAEFSRAKYVQAGWPPAKLVVKYNTAREPAARRHGAGDGFVCLSRLVPEKGVDVLLRAWAIAFPKGEEQLTVIGSGDADEELRRTAPAGVVFAGRLGRAEAIALVRDARAIVLPSRWYEVFPRTLVEAYSLGVPAIASDIGALSELVEDGVTGVLVDAGSPDSLARALRTLAASPELAQRLGGNARRRYDERYAPAATTARLLEIYGEARALARVAA